METKELYLLLEKKINEFEEQITVIKRRLEIVTDKSKHIFLFNAMHKLYTKKQAALELMIDLLGE